MEGETRYTLTYAHNGKWRQTTFHSKTEAMEAMRKEFVEIRKPEHNEFTMEAINNFCYSDPLSALEDSFAYAPDEAFGPVHAWRISEDSC